MAENIEVVEQPELVEKKELSELMERDYAAESLYDEYNTQRIKADVAHHKDMTAYYEGQCEALINEKVAQLEQLELTKVQRTALVERYQEYADECLKKGNGALCKYYRESASRFNEPYAKEASQEWYEQFSARTEKSLAELNDSIQEHQEWKAVHFAPSYTGETGSHVYRYDAQKEYEKNGESPRFKELMEMAREIPTEANYFHIQRALAALIKNLSPEPYVVNDDAPLIIKSVMKYAYLDGKYNNENNIKTWIEQVKKGDLDSLKKLASYYIDKSYDDEKNNFSKFPEDMRNIGKAFHLYAIYSRIQILEEEGDVSRIAEIADLYLKYNVSEGKKWLDKGIAMDEPSALFEAYKYYECYGYEWFEISEYRNRAINQGYWKAINDKKNEMREWEREKAAMRQEEYLEKLAEQKRSDQERAEKRKQLDEKLDWSERFLDSDGYTHEEKYLMGKEDIYDKMQNDRFRETLHDWLD